MESIIPALFPLTYFALLLAERLLGGRRFPKVRWWIPKGILFFFIGGLINSTLPVALARVFAGHTLLDLSSLGLAGTVVAVIASTFVSYWLHRTFHRFSGLWRWTHQMHHSAERVDMAGFGYSHPFELLIAVGMTPLVASIIGVAPEAAMLAGYLTFVLGLVEHFNVKTPQWLGYIVQRPEMHCVHHERGVHAYNYGLPLWDMLFGTLRNPKAWSGQAGFWDGASKQTFAMLAGRDVAVPPHVAAVANAVPERIAA
ncbi:MAG TPA: sterol desaturase family protein [Kofleriaceae bacterium]|nr:sterol desaturase family protein [Kofleriaceae bacterium]